MSIERLISELSLEEKAGLCSGADYWHTKRVERLGIPDVMMCDGPHGLRKQDDKTDMLGINDSIKAVCFPSASALAASFDRNLLKKLGACLGNECQAEGIGMLLGPGLNIKRSPLCGRNFEYFSEDPYLTGELAVSYVKSIQEKGVAACAKHFACNNQETRRMSGNSQVEERTLHEIYLPAFEKVVKEGRVRSIMCAYNAVNGTFCAENKELLTDILRKKWGYEGFVVTDWGAVKNRVMGLLAGLDLEMPGGVGAQDEKIVAAVKSGELDEKVLDEAVSNLLRFVDEYQVQKNVSQSLDLKKDHQVAVELATECAVLLKNEESVLPLKKESKIAFIGDFAGIPRFQGSGSSHVNAFRVTGAYQAAKNQDMNVVYTKGYCAEETTGDEELLRESVQAAKEAEAAVIFVGLPDSLESEGVDRTSMDMPQNQNDLIEAVAAVQPDTVVVLHAGAPVIMPWQERVKAILNVYLGGEGVGEATVSLLYGATNPCGKLAETFPVKLSDNPSYLNFPGEEGVVPYQENIYVGYRYYDKKEMGVVFPFGYGLSYTTFEYRDLELGKAKMKDIEKLQVSCNVKNTGKYPGKEVVQLYVGAKQSEVSRPIRELKGFEKVELWPGEEKAVTFTLDKNAFAYYNTKIYDWYVESGIYVIEIGASSRDIRLQKEIEVEGTVELQIHFTMSSTVGQLIKNGIGKHFIVRMIQKFKGMSEEGNENQTEDDSSLEEINRIIQSTMIGMPLTSLVTYGAATEEELEQLIEELNRAFADTPRYQGSGRGR